MKKLKMPKIDAWQKRLIAKSERLRRMGRPRQGEGEHQTPSADAQAGPVALAASAPRRSRHKDADDLQAITVDYQQALEIRWWYYRRNFLEAMKLDLEIRNEQTQ